MVAELQPGDPRKVGPYWLLGRLGSGGMGQVFLGRSPGGRQVAVKVVHANLAEQAEFRIRFAREASAARTVSGLFTAPVVDADLNAPVPWLATAYVAGPSLADAVAMHGPLPVSSVLALAAGLAEGLGAIHAAGIVHRDLKPSNVLLAQDGPRVIDFGISRAAEYSTLTGTGMVVGSPGFMSPEQVQGHEMGPPSDVFSLGAVLAFAATGEGPFGTGTAATLLYRVVFTPPVMTGLPAALRPLIERCLAKDPQQRPTTSQLLSELNTHPVPGWLPAPLSRGFPAYIPPGPGPAGASAAGAPSAKPTGRPDDALSFPVPPSGPSIRSTLTSAQIPAAAAAQPQSRGDQHRRGRRRPPAWALIIAVAVAIAAAVAIPLGARPHQTAATRGHPPSPAPSTLATTAPKPRTSTITPAAPTGVFWTAAVLSSHDQQHAQAEVQRLHQSGFDGAYWWSTASNSVLPGYWVVTSGRFGDEAAAAGRVRALQADGFTGAYARCVGPRQGCPSQS